MRTFLGPGELPNNPITVRLVSGLTKTCYGFPDLMVKDGQVTAMFKHRLKWIKVRQIKPYEWEEWLPASSKTASVQEDEIDEDDEVTGGAYFSDAGDYDGAVSPLD